LKNDLFLGIGPVLESSDVESDSSEHQIKLKFEVGKPDWKHKGFQQVQKFSYALPSSIEDLKYPLKKEPNAIRSLRISHEQFCKSGACRDVFKAEMVQPKSDIIAASAGKAEEKANESNNMKTYLAKIHKTFSDLETNELNVLDDLQIQTICAFLAQKFCKLPEIKHAGLKKKLKFLKANGIRFKDSSLRQASGQSAKDRERFACIEEILQGGEDYQKWTNNASYVDKDAEPILLAFIHWTWHVTDGYMMVCDIQGIETKKDEITEFVLTDPCLHCKDVTRYQTTNTGTEGMKMFFATHQCNDICKMLKLKPYEHTPE
jgi:hypothetical protein